MPILARISSHKLILAEEGGDKISDEQLLGNLYLILIAGHDTTLNTMALSVNALAAHPEARNYMREHPDDILKCVSELMRYIARWKRRQSKLESFHDFSGNFSTKYPVNDRRVRKSDSKS